MVADVTGKTQRIGATRGIQTQPGKVELSFDADQTALPRQRFDDSAPPQSEKPEPELLEQLGGDGSLIGKGVDQGFVTRWPPWIDAHITLA